MVPANNRFAQFVADILEFMRIWKIKKEYGFSQNGFTLIELVVTISIMALVLSLTLANLNGTELNRNNTIAQNVFISDMHKIQTFSLNSADYTPGVIPASSWSVHINSSTPTSYDLQVTDNNLISNTKVYSTTNLPKKITFSTLQVITAIGSCFDANDLVINFTVPYGRILMSYTGTSCSNGVVTSVIKEANDIVNINFPIGAVSINGIAGNINSSNNF
jgi:prepilin-type N-terminal cleavage/methylation domain-containing protein